MTTTPTAAPAPAAAAPAADPLLRTARQGCWQLKSNSWGRFLAPIADPLANVELNDEQLQSLELRAELTPIPAELWRRWILLCFHFNTTGRRQLEVSCRFLRHVTDKSRWRIAVPPQSVDGASVRAETFDGAIDIETGEIIDHWPPEDWTPCGSSHSHNTMSAFFSNTDDHYELGDPGLHIVVGSLDNANQTYQLKASVTANRRRFAVPYEAVIDCSPEGLQRATASGATFHPAVLAVVQLDLWEPRHPQWPASRQSHPNAGNGYARATDDELWYWDLDTAGPSERLRSSDLKPLDISELTEGLREWINAAISRGDDRAIPEALWALRDHIEDVIDSLADIDAQLNAVSHLP